MSKSILSKVAAFACSVASIAALSLSASAEKLEVNKDNFNLVDDKVNIVAAKVELTLKELAAANYQVDVDVDINNNASFGFGPSGIALVYPADAGLKVVEQDGEKAITGPVGDKINAYITDNSTDKGDGKTPNIACGSTAMKNVTIDGTHFTRVNILS